MSCTLSSSPNILFHNSAQKNIFPLAHCCLVAKWVVLKSRTQSKALFTASLTIQQHHWSHLCFVDLRPLLAVILSSVFVFCVGIASRRHSLWQVSAWCCGSYGPVWGGTIWLSNHPLAAAPRAQVLATSKPYILVPEELWDNKLSFLWDQIFTLLHDRSFCILLWVLLLSMFVGLSSSSPHQSSPVPTHYYRDLGNRNHHHRDHQAPGRRALRNSFRVLHPKNHLPPWSARDSQRLVKLLLFVFGDKETVYTHVNSCGFSAFFTKQKHKHIYLCLPSQRPTPLREKDCVPVPCVQRSKNPLSKPARWWSRRGCPRKSWTSGRSEPSQKGQKVTSESQVWWAICQINF